MIHNPDGDAPLEYYDADGTPVESEFPQPSDNVRVDLRSTLFLDAYDGHPFIRLFRRYVRRRSNIKPQNSAALIGLLNAILDAESLRRFRPYRDLEITAPHKSGSDSGTITKCSGGS
jgi:hypothetical protein